MSGAGSKPAEAKPSAGSLGRAATSGVAWLMVNGLSTRACTFISQILLALLLAPADFGSIGLAYTVTTVANALVDVGVGDVLLQRQRTIRLWSAPAFWINLALSSLGMLLVLVAAPFAAAAYHSNDLVGLVSVLATGMPLAALSTIPTVMMRASLNFRFLAIYNTFEIMTTQAATILLAWLGFGPYSFVIPVPVMAALRALLFWLKAPPHLRGRVRPFQFKYLVGNGIAVFGKRVIITAVGQGDYVVLGLMASHTVVGLYFFAFRLAAQPMWVLAGSFQTVMLPALSQLRLEPERQGKAALSAVRLLLYAMMPLCFLQAALADPLIHLLFGTKWIGAIPMVQILSLGMPFDGAAWIAGALLNARGEFGRAFVYACVSAPFFFLAVIVGAWLNGALGVAIGVAIYYAIVTPTFAWVVFRRYGARADELGRLYLLPPLTAGAAIGAAYAVSLVPIWTADALVRGAIIAGLGPLLYAGLLHLMLPETLRELLHRSGVERLGTRLLQRVAQPKNKSATVSH